MPHIFRLPNGLTGVVEERPGSGLVSFSLASLDGSMSDAPDQAGLTFLTQATVDSGTTTRTRVRIAEAIENTGSSFSTSSNRHMRWFSASILADQVETVVRILADVVKNPVFGPAEIDKARERIKEYQSERAQDPDSRTFDRFCEAAYGGGEGANYLGTEELIDSYTPAQVRAHHAAFLAHPEEMVVALSGDIDVETAEDLVRRWFGDIPAAAAAKLRPAPVFTGGDIREETETAQINLAFGFPAPSKLSADYMACTLLRGILSGGMSSPLFQEVREKRGLVYGISTDYRATSRNGAFVIQAGASPENARELIAVSLRVLGDALRNGFSAEQIRASGARIIAGIKNAKETTGGTNVRNMNDALMFGRCRTLEEVEAALRRVTSDDLRRVCAAMLDGGKMALSAIGPLHGMPSEAEIRAMIQAELEGFVMPPPAACVDASEIAAAIIEEKYVEQNPRMTVLPNGIRVVTLERPGSLSIGAWVGAGADDEPPHLSGASHMNEHMSFKGTESYAPGEIDAIVETMGGNLNAHTSYDETAYYYNNIPPAEAAKIVDICAEMVFCARTPEDEYDGKMIADAQGVLQKAQGERDVVVEEIKMYSADMNSRSFAQAMSLAYPGQSHGRPILGTEDILRALTASDLAAHRAQYYVPGNVVFSAAGPVRHEDFVAMVERKTGAFPSQAFPPAPVPHYVGGTGAIEMPTAEIPCVLLMMEGVPDTDPDAWAYRALGELLSGGESARLTKALVHDKALTSDIGASDENYRSSGLFYVWASVKARNIKSFLKGTYQEICKTAGSVTPAELNKIKASLVMEELQAAERNDALCQSLGSTVLVLGRPELNEEVLQKIQGLTVDDLCRAARKVMASNPTVSLVVPPGTKSAHLPSHEEVLAFRDKALQDASLPPAPPPPEGPQMRLNA